jgi:hypothetical protein
MDAKNGIEQAAAVARGAERKAAPWVERLARLGYAAKGVVYVLIGYIAAHAAVGAGGEVEGWNGALGELRDEPGGTLMLWLIGIGLLGYVIWRFVAAVRNPENEDAAHRAFFVFSGVAYAGLALAAFRLATGGGGSNNDTHWTSTLMEQPFGRVLVALAGVGIAGYGLQQLWSAWTIDLDKRLDLSPLSAAARGWVIRLGRFGMAARGIVLVMLGYIFLRAALKERSSEPGNVEGVLDSLRGTPWLLAIVALGFIAYGLFNLVRARYRRISAA